MISGVIVDAREMKHVRLVPLKIGHFDEKIFIALKEALALIEVPIDKVESPSHANLRSI